MGRAVAQNASGCAAGFINSSSLWIFFPGGGGRVEGRAGISLPGSVFSTKEKFLNLTKKIDEAVWHGGASARDMGTRKRAFTSARATVQSSWRWHGSLGRFGLSLEEKDGAAPAEAEMRLQSCDRLTSGMGCGRECNSTDSVYQKDWILHAHPCQTQDFTLGAFLVWSGLLLVTCSLS